MLEGRFDDARDMLSEQSGESAWWTWGLLPCLIGGACLLVVLLIQYPDGVSAGIGLFILIIILLTWGSTARADAPVLAYLACPYRP